MKEMGVGAHPRDPMAKGWSLSKIRARLARKTLEQVNLERGPPMVLERVVRRCEERWAKKKG